MRVKLGKDLGLLSCFEYVGLTSAYLNCCDFFLISSDIEICKKFSAYVTCIDWEPSISLKTNPRPETSSQKILTKILDFYNGLILVSDV